MKTLSRNLILKAKRHKIILIYVIILFIALIGFMIFRADKHDSTTSRVHEQKLKQSVSNSVPIQLTPQEQKNLATAEKNDQQAGQGNQSTPTNTSSQPKVLLDVSGNGSNQTQTFMTASNWTVDYTYSCSNSGYFSYTVENSDGSANGDIGANEQGASGGSIDYYYDTGQHYIKIIAACSWHITVKA